MVQNQHSFRRRATSTVAFRSATGRSFAERKTTLCCLSLRARAFFRGAKDDSSVAFRSAQGRSVAERNTTGGWQPGKWGTGGGGGWAVSLAVFGVQRKPRPLPAAPGDLSAMGCLALGLPLLLARGIFSPTAVAAPARGLDIHFIDT